jgi:hypothetical protein
MSRTCFILVLIPIVFFAVVGKAENRVQERQEVSEWKLKLRVRRLKKEV